MRPTVSRLLTRHFLRRFFENDLISPHVDLHENTFMVCAAIVASSLFLSVLLGGKYMFGLPPPGVIAIGALGDNFGFISLSMFAMALVAAVQWDALSLDARDTANLGPLPIPRRVLVRAKLTALLIFAGGFAIALNIFASTIFQGMVVIRTPVGLSGLMRMVGAHVVASLVASAAAFVSVIALREVLRAILGDRWFGRISAFLQGVLVLCFTIGLLTTPAIASQLTRDWARNGMPSRWAVPALAFAGFEQALNDGVIARARQLDRYTPRSDRLSKTNVNAVAAYNANRPFFHDNLTIVPLVTLGIVVVAAGAYAWNLRRPPQPVAASGTRRRIARTIGTLAGAGDSVRRAGATFALQAIVRSAPHRLSMAGAGALAVALSLGFLARANFEPAPDPWMPRRTLLAVQIVFVTVLVVGFRRAVRVPAELRANWAMQMASYGDRRFLSGIKRAAVAGVAVPALVMLFPLNVWLMSVEVAAVHALIGLCFSVAICEGLFMRSTKVPLASTYEPLGSLKTTGPGILLVFLAFVSLFTKAERDLLQSRQGVIAFAVAWLLLAAVFRAIDYWSMRAERPMRFDEPPEPATQGLELSG